MVKKPMLELASEADEAQWWADHQDDLDQFIGEPTSEQVATARALMSRARPTAPEKLAAFREQVTKGSTEQIALRVPVADLELAKSIAARKGIGYQTLLKMAIHEWLEREQAG